MLHSTVTSKGQTTIPEKIRRALRIKPGDKLEYEVQGTAPPFVCIPAFDHSGGVLACKKGKGMSVAEIRKAAMEAGRAREESRE